METCMWTWVRPKAGWGRWGSATPPLLLLVLVPLGSHRKVGVDLSGGLGLRLPVCWLKAAAIILEYLPGW